MEVLRGHRGPLARDCAIAALEALLDGSPFLPARVVDLAEAVMKLGALDERAA